MGYGLSYGDYQGDPFLGGLIKGAFKFAKGGITNLIGRGATSGQGMPTFPGVGIPRARFVRPSRTQAVTRTPGIRGAAQRLFPGGATGYEVAKPGRGGMVEGSDEWYASRRRRRMNPANAKALRRAIRRQDGFIKLARRALKGSGYTIVSRGSRRPQRDLGRGHTHVR